ncbi:MAG: glucodextranase DOMON-like domain-containing protein [Thermoanaerobaculia bacterium]
MKIRFWRVGTAAAAGLLVAGAVFAQGSVSFKDPANDDNGPGGYTYPTDTVYKRGSFDLAGLDVKASGKKVDFTVNFNAPMEDPWRMGTGFSVQQVFIFVKTGAEGGFKDAPPGLNVTFADGNEWNKVIVLSPQPPGRVKNEVEQKVAQGEQASVIIPARVKGTGRSISASVDLDQLGGGDPSQWGYQVVVQSNEGFPEGKDFMTRKVNEYEGQHRFGGGTDSDCDPHAIDILAGNGTGAADEAQAQHDMLKYECNPDGSRKSGAALKMVYGKK